MFLALRALKKTRGFAGKADFSCVRQKTNLFQVLWEDVGRAENVFGESVQIKTGEETNSDSCDHDQHGSHQDSHNHPHRGYTCRRQGKKQLKLALFISE